MLIRTLLTVVISISVCGFAKPDGPYGPQVETEPQREIGQALANWVIATNRGDEVAANTIWGPNVVGWFPAAREFSNEAASEIAGLPEKKDGAYSTYELKIEEIAASGEIASVYDIWTETRHFKGSEVTVKRTIRGNELWRHQPDGKWKIVRWVSAPEKWHR